MTRRLHPATQALVALFVAALTLVATVAWLVDDRPAPVRTPAPLLPIDPTLPRFVTPPASPRAVEVSHATTGPAPLPARPVVAPPAWARCPRWWRTAQRAGWPADELPTLDYVMWRESRCVAHVVSTTNDHGLSQVNARHLSAPGYAELCARSGGRICTTADLAKPRKNLRAARLLYLVAQDWFGCGWQPWRTATWRPC